MRALFPILLTVGLAGTAIAGDEGSGLKQSVPETNASSLSDLTPEQWQELVRHNLDLAYVDCAASTAELTVLRESAWLDAALMYRVPMDPANREVGASGFDTGLAGAVAAGDIVLDETGARLIECSDEPSRIAGREIWADERFQAYVRRQAEALRDLDDDGMIALLSGVMDGYGCAVRMEQEADFMVFAIRYVAAAYDVDLPDPMPEEEDRTFTRFVQQVSWLLDDAAQLMRNEGLLIVEDDVARLTVCPSDPAERLTDADWEAGVTAALQAGLERCVIPDGGLDAFLGRATGAVQAHMPAAVLSVAEPRPHLVAAIERLRAAGDLLDDEDGLRLRNCADLTTLTEVEFEAYLDAIPDAAWTDFGAEMFAAVGCRVPDEQFPGFLFYVDEVLVRRLDLAEGATPADRIAMVAAMYADGEVAPWIILLGQVRFHSSQAILTVGGIGVDGNSHVLADCVPTGELANLNPYLIALGEPPVETSDPAIAQGPGGNVPSGD